jgi:hypothetical protein
MPRDRGHGAASPLHKGERLISGCGAGVLHRAGRPLDPNFFDGRGVAQAEMGIQGGGTCGIEASYLTELRH